MLCTELMGDGRVISVISLYCQWKFSVATPENTEEVQGVGLLCCTSSTKLQHPEVKCYRIAPSI